MIGQRGSMILPCTFNFAHSELKTKSINACPLVSCLVILVIYGHKEISAKMCTSEQTRDLLLIGIGYKEFYPFIY